MKLLIISSSLSSDSRSRVMAEYIADQLKEKNPETELIDLKNYTLSVCDGDKSYNDPIVKQLKIKISQAQGIIIATPVYNFNVNAALKNLVELTGKAWNDKIVGFICSAGGNNSYMAVMGLANSLMLDFRCVIIPRFVYSSDGSESLNDSIKKRLDVLSSELIRFVIGLSNV